MSIASTGVILAAALQGVALHAPAISADSLRTIQAGVEGVQLSHLLAVMNNWVNWLGTLIAAAGFAAGFIVIIAAMMQFQSYKTNLAAMNAQYEVKMRQLDEKFHLDRLRPPSEILASAKKMIQRDVCEQRHSTIQALEARLGALETLVEKRLGGSGGGKGAAA